MLSKYDSKFQYIWVINSLKNSINLSTDTIIVKKSSFLYYYYFLTSKIVVSNIGKHLSIPIRNNQCFVETWHGGGTYKHLKIDIHGKRKFMAYTVKKASEEISKFITSSEKYSAIISNDMYVDETKFIKCGMPRNDIFFYNYSGIKEKVKEYYQIDNETKIVLYAPTYRGLFSKASIESINCSLIDVQSCLNALKTRFSGKFVLMHRMHFSITCNYNNKTDSCINANDYPDMQELLCAADVLITDYSSCMWDFSFTGKPCFLYAPDLAEYDTERMLYTPIETWPAILAEDNETLVQNILSFDDVAFAHKVKKHHEDLGSYETGHATEQIVEIIYEECFGNKHE